MNSGVGGVELVSLRSRVKKEFELAVKVGRWSVMQEWRKGQADRPACSSRGTPRDSSGSEHYSWQGVSGPRGSLCFAIIFSVSRSSQMLWLLSTSLL